MENLITSAMEIRNRTLVTSLLSDRGFKITMTDFDDMSFEGTESHINVHYDLFSNVESITVVPK
ncbi:hypothetical protein HGP28_08660 [Vibrio sp. SM6]|uniref:Uncharacterized protein n=1 Tax=Vibrio agarilyticus TaxID=2726741 RepID=A0A7X8TQN3_9VIBR|nr:hypothetical protein [Vibrio agarilyticus]NLS12960.1 hypothetical protein [Vibrio agarilyticus]